MNYPTDKPNPKRENTLKVPLNDTEASSLRKFCSSVGQQVAPFVRQAVFAHMRAAAPAANATPARRRGEWPRHGHVQRFPGRPAVAGGFHRRL